MSLLAMAQVKAGVPPGCTNDAPGLWFLKFFARTALASMNHRDDKYIYICDYMIVVCISVWLGKCWKHEFKAGEGCHFARMSVTVEK